MPFFSREDDSNPTLFGLALTTHRDMDMLQQQQESSMYFQYEAAIASLSIGFFRSTCSGQRFEHWLFRWFFAILLAVLAYCKKSYELISAVELFSYAVPWLLARYQTRRQPATATATNNKQSLPSSSQKELFGKLLVSITISAAVSLSLAHFAASGYLYETVSRLTPSLVVQALKYMFPVDEMMAAYKILSSFGNPIVLRQQLDHLLFVTFHIQSGLGFLGIEFLRREQSRRNQLVRMDVEDDGEEYVSQQQKETRASAAAAAAAMNANGDTMKQQSSQHDNKNGRSSVGAEKSQNIDDKQPAKAKSAKSLQERKMERSRRFRASAAPFILFTSLPYMLQIIVYGNINKFAYTCVQDDLHRTIRVHELFENDNHLTAMSLDSPTSPEAFAASMNSVMSTCYDLWNRKLFSLPKILLLPAVMSRQPFLVVQVFPFIFLSDWIKANAVAYLTTRIEQLQKETNELKAVRSKVESFDIKNAELLQRSGKGATQFTQRRWEELTVKIQNREVLSDLMGRTKALFSFVQRNFVFSVLIDCALANLIAVGRIVSSEIFVFSRAVEDAVDMVLMRSRGEAELARMMTEIDKLQELANIWDRSLTRNLLPCNLALPSSHPTQVLQQQENPHHAPGILLRNLHYTRGTASVRADHVEIPPGVYALTGANGSGKSTLFRILMSCNTNDKSIDLPSSINLLTPMEPLFEEDDFMRAECCDAGREGGDDDDDIDDDDVDNDKANASSSTSKECEIGINGECVPTTDAVDKEGLAKPSKSRLELVHPKPKLSITMPSSHVIEISQNFYWPLYSRPIDWIYQEHVSETCCPEESERRVRRVAEELQRLEFFQPAQLSSDTTGNATTSNGSDDNNGKRAPEESTIRRIMAELQEEKEDWFGDLSGGQKSKVELVRKVFLHDRCPDVLLIDETMAPLDPSSKSLVMTRLKQFCRDSIIIVIYHTDVGRGIEVEGKMVEECVPSNNFFDKNIHVERGQLLMRATC